MQLSNFTGDKKLLNKILLPYGWLGRIELKCKDFYLKYSSCYTILIATISTYICQMATPAIHLNMICIVTWGLLSVQVAAVLYCDHW